MPGMGAMNPGSGPVMAPPPPPTQAQSAQGNGVHHAQASSPTDPGTMAMQQQQPPPGGGPNGPNVASNSSGGAAGSAGQYYGAPPAGAQMQNVGNDVSKFSNSGNSGSGPTPVHAQQQNGYVPQPSSQGAGANSYGASQPPSAQQQASAGNQPNAGGAAQASGGAGGGGAAGTWTGPNTLTYTQSMQPPDPRSLPASYCTCKEQCLKIITFANYLFFF